MIKLSNRLNTIADFIDKEDNVIDIGCDHALLDIYLEKKHNKIYYASDLRDTALEMARNNIKKYRSKKLVLKCGNGLDVIEQSDNIDTLIIAGMGYQTIIKILNDNDKMNNINKIIIQSNTNPEIVKKYLIRNGFYIDKEKIVVDKNIYYIVTCYKRGKRKYSDLDTEIGTFESNEDLSKYLDIEIKKNRILLSLIPLSDIMRRIKIRRRLRLLIKKKNSMK